jgi:hypothetical protein
MKRRALALCAGILLMGLAPGSALASGTLDQSNDAGLVPAADVWGAHVFAQTFTASLSGSIPEVDMYMDGIGPITIGIRATALGLPTGPDLVTSGSVGLGTEAWYAFTFSTPPSVTAGLTYAIVFTLSDSNVTWGDYGTSTATTHQRALVETSPGVWTAPTSMNDTLYPTDPRLLGQFAFEEYVQAAAPAPPTTTCGGSVTFPDQPEGYWLEITQPGTSLDVVSQVPFGSIGLDPGSYAYQWYIGNPDGGTLVEGASGTFSIGTCPPPVRIPAPTPTAAPTPTPFQSIQGATAAPTRGVTPPPTATGGSFANHDGSGLWLLPVVLLACFGVLTLFTTRTRRRIS